MEGGRGLYPRRRLFLCMGMATCTFLMACIALHDRQTAEGVGLYFAIALQREDRLVFDLLVDGLGAAALLLLVTVPCAVGRADKLMKICLLLVAFVALMPAVSPASLLHLFSNPDNYRICKGVKELMTSASLLAPAAGGYLPVFCLLLAAGRLHGSGRISVRQRVFLVAQPALAVLALMFPGFAPHLSFVMQYLFLLAVFEAWGRLHENAESFSVWEIVLFLGLWLRSGYVLFELMSKY
ncbi:MAG: hypothetical protein NC543_02600 [bacterium]|nr:hypothetical protein [bacterium]MCM1374252.1 hypothetical protein [Muribaculum sp.]